MPISTMKKLTVLAYSTDADAIVRRLMKLKCVSIDRLPGEERQLTEISREEALEASAAEDRLAELKAAIPILGKYTTRRRGIGRYVHSIDRRAFLQEGRGERALNAAREAIAVQRQRGESEEALTRNRTARTALLPWLEYDAPLCDVGTAHTVHFLGTSTSKRPELSAIEEAGGCVEVVSGGPGEWYLSVFCHKEQLSAVSEALAQNAFVKLSFEGCRDTALREQERLEREAEAIEREDSAFSDRLLVLSDFLDDIEILSDIEETELEIYRQKQKLYRTKLCVCLTGWIPETTSERVTEALSRFECAVELSDPEEGDDPPVLLKNNSFSATFEWVIGMYSYPKYGTYDPTVIMSIFYFLIFGLMFADVGYGLLLTVGAFAGVKLLNPKEGLKRSLYMFGFCGISCMLLGVLFGGWFGDLPTAIMNSFFPEFGGNAAETPIGSFFANGPIALNPVAYPTHFLVLSLVMGEIHLMAGMAINLVETWKSGERLEAVCANVPFWILFIGLDMLAPAAIVGMLIFVDMTPESQAILDLLSQIGGYVTVAGFASILLCKGLAKGSFRGWLMAGLGGLYSLISFASDLLSYSRILALGLVAGVIAQVINMLTGLGATGPIGFIFMLIVMVAGHALNLAINILGTFVHAARLQYIEFFGKFYEDGGKIFVPAAPVENYSEDIDESELPVKQ